MDAWGGYMSAEDHRVAVLGASAKPERYANKAIRLLKDHHYQVIPIHPRTPEIEGLPVAKSLRDVKHPIHTLTVYVGPERSRSLAEDMIALEPKRVILNPGAESEYLESKLKEAHIPFVKACTLVLLHTGQFETVKG
jgi:predicted CoA-binding protein